jgi:hypothetical protein
MLYRVIRKDSGSQFIAQGTLIQPRVGDVFSGQLVTRTLCLIPSEGSPEVCSTRSVIMGMGILPIANTPVEFYFPVNYVRAVIGFGGMYVTIPALLIGVGVAFVGYKLLSRKK